MNSSCFYLRCFDIFPQLLLGIAVGLLTTLSHSSVQAASQDWADTFDQTITQWKVPPPQWVLGKNIFEPIHDKIGGIDNSGALRFDGNGARRGRVFMNRNVPREPQTLSLWIKTHNFAPGWTVRVRMMYMDKQNKFIKFTQQVNTPADQPNTDWTCYSLKINVPDKAHRMRILLETFRINSKAAKQNTGIAWLDSISLMPQSQGPQTMIQSVTPGGMYGMIDAGQPMQFSLQLNPTVKKK